jgi:hypothetical protein
MEAVTETTAEPSAADLVAAVVPFLENVALSVFSALDEIARLIQDALDSRVVCVQCAAERQKAMAEGVPEEHLPPVNTANIIAGGDGRCFAHVQFTDRVPLPGQTPSGLYVAGAGAVR